MCGLFRCIADSYRTDGKDGTVSRKNAIRMIKQKRVKQDNKRRLRSVQCELDRNPDLNEFELLKLADKLINSKPLWLRS